MDSFLRLLSGKQLSSFGCFSAIWRFGFVYEAKKELREEGNGTRTVVNNQPCLVSSLPCGLSLRHIKPENRAVETLSNGARRRAVSEHLEPNVG
jgi:hypothetical protein